jgi:hypothetical protein
LPTRLAALLGLGLIGCHAGLGPVVGYRFDDDARIGWEASGGYAIARASVGQAFSYGEQADTDFYAAAEPGLLIGLTLGADHAGSEGWDFMPGAWVGVPFYVQENTTYRIGGERYDLLGSAALGYRHAHGHEIYFAPKVYLFEHITIAH